ncbi:MAG: hypothetical protein QM817_39530 [Archangium sp.]
MRALWFLGATGSVGTRVLAQLTQRSNFSRLVTIGRRATSFDVEHHATDFSAEFPLPDGPVTDVVSTLGSNYVTASREEFWRIDHDVPLRVAREAHRRGARRFVLVSTFGAHPLAPMIFARARGVLERELARLGFDDLVCLRPAFVTDSDIARTPLERLALRLTSSLAARSERFARSALAPTTCDRVADEVVRHLV